MEKTKIMELISDCSNKKEVLKAFSDLKNQCQYYRKLSDIIHSKSAQLHISRQYICDMLGFFSYELTDDEYMTCATALEKYTLKLIRGEYTIDFAYGFEIDFKDLIPSVRKKMIVDEFDLYVADEDHTVTLEKVVVYKPLKTKTKTRRKAKKE